MTSEQSAIRAHMPHSTHPAFEWLRSEPVESLNLVVQEYRHRRTGAHHFHLAADNDENVFLVALRTVPEDSTGVAHILEHTALCGSERYPVRDPFFMMIRRSLNTFMNAFTSSDWTAYPFASKNRKDFDNLLDVYLDAVFFSRLDALDFAQEGHRLEFAVPDDPASGLVRKGVVYNEMKGAMSSPVSILWQTLTRYLFPTTTYHHNSGGDPQHIPDLSYEQLKAFYRTHYHPSNAVFMTYGDIAAEEHHEAFERLALSRFQRLDECIEVRDEKRYFAPVRVEESYPLQEDEAAGDNTHIVIGWLLGRSTDLASLLRAHLLSGVLLSNSASPLRHALETTGLGRAPSPLCGVEDSNREMSFMCGLEGSRPEHARAVEELVFGVLHQVAADGVPQEQVDSVLHQLELSQREIKGDSYPYGLHLILAGLSPAIHRGDPVAVLNLDPVLEALRREAQDPEFIKGLVREWLLDNPHRVHLTLTPDTEFAARRDRAEAAQLAAIEPTLDQDQRRRLVERAKELAARQDQHDDPEILPKVGLDDIPAQMHIATGSEVHVAGLPVTFFDQGTNGLVYQQLVTELPVLEDELLDLLPYYTAFLSELGCAGRDYRETQIWQARVSGGMHAYASVRAMVDDVQAVRGYFVLSGKALARNHEALAELMQQTFETVRFDEHDRIRELVSQKRARRERSITGSGHSLAMKAAASGMSPAAALSHRLGGLAGIKYVKALDDDLKEAEAIEALAHRLRRIHERVLAAPRRLLLVAEAERRAALHDAVARHWRAEPLGSGAFSRFSLPAVADTVREAWTTSTQVNFCAKAYPTVPVDHPDGAALVVLGGFLRNGHLHRAIRERGGAYGAGAGQDSDAAAFRFYSYRDPRLIETLDDFDAALRWLQEETHEPRQLEEAVLGVIAAMDKPGSPAGEAKQAFHNALFGRDREQRQRFRERVLAVSLDDLRRVGATYLRPEQASIAVVTNTAGAERLGELGLTSRPL